jgi:hypothetical protein
VGDRREKQSRKYPVVGPGGDHSSFAFTRTGVYDGVVL